jgi:succinyl-diaminopimelate desuccinylase
MDFQQVSDWIASRQDEMVELQRELTARPALGPENGGKGEWEKARFLQEYLAAHGLNQVRHFDCPDDRVPEGTRPNFSVTIQAGEPGPRQWIMSHMDVVPPGERLPDGSWKGWGDDPWEVQLLDDMVVGRGVSDNQQAIISSVFAARALVENGLKPVREVKLLFVSDEETGSRHGLIHVLQQDGGPFLKDDIIIVPDAGNDDGSMIEVAEKSLLWLGFRVEGVQTHASRPDQGVNACRAAADLIHELDKELHARFDRVDHLFDMPHSTFEPTRHDANVPNVNTIPGEDVFFFDCRVLPGYSLDAVFELAQAQARRIDGAFGTTTEVSITSRQDAPPSTPADSPVVRLLKPAVGQVRGVKPVVMGIGGLTVAAPLRQAGYRVAVWMTCMGKAHQVNETCRIADMVGDAQVLAHTFLHAV